MSTPIKYVALLRGINVGGHRMIRKEELTDIFTNAGCSDVQTLLASGNVVFSSDVADESAVTDLVESALETALGYRVDVMVRTVAYIRSLVELDPFAGYEPVSAKFYVTFLTRAPDSIPDLPQDLPDQNAIAVALHEREFFSIARKTADGRYGDFGPFMKAAFGKQPVTTRNWNTVVKVANM